MYPSDSVETAPQEFKNGGFSLKRDQRCFLSLLHRGNLKPQQSPVILDLCLRKTQSGKSRDYRDVVVFEKLRIENVFHMHTNI